MVRRDQSANKPLDRTTRSVVSHMFQVEHP
jgi:hypothetical protein